MTQESQVIEHILSHRRVGPDCVLVVHSGFRHLSNHGLSAEVFCQTLIDAIPNVTLLMPTMTWRTVNPSSPIFDEMETPSHTGILTEVFRTKYASHRSLHPTHSVAGYGPLAPHLLSTHHLGTTPCPSSSPYGLMRDYDAHILTLGVGLECCTAFHHPEEVIAPDLYVRPMAEAEPYTLIDRDGRKHHVMTRRHVRLPRDYPRFGPILESKARLSSGIILDTPWQLFAAKDLYQELFQALVRCPDAILALEHQK